MRAAARGPMRPAPIRSGGAAPMSRAVYNAGLCARGCTGMNLLIYLFSASFVFMALALLFAYQRTHHYGLFIMGLTYGTSAALALVFTHWWPLAAGFALVWVFKL